ncbi:hypothetical protein GGI43DRAFT_390376 [Trichoderma evansii]
MFVKSSSILLLLLSALRLASATTIKIGYSSTLVPGLPGPEPGVGCGMWAEAMDGSDSALADFVTNGSEPTDDCPAADVVLFCQRWGCPFNMIFAQVLVVTVNSDNHDDKSISVTATHLNGPTVTVTCPWVAETISSSDSGGLFAEWSCEV